MDNKFNMNIPAEKFRFVHDGERLHDKKFDDKPIGFFKDAMSRFRKNRASVIAFIIIVLILLYAIITPFLYSDRELSFRSDYYAKKPARVVWLKENLGIMDGGVSKKNTQEADMVSYLSIGWGTANVDGDTALEIDYATAMANEYQPLLKVSEPKETLNNKKQVVNQYDIRYDSYLSVGFVNYDIEQQELANILKFEEETGLKVLYPLIDENEWHPAEDGAYANVWYKARGVGRPVTVNETTGKVKNVTFGEDMVLEDNYLRDENGNLQYSRYVGGGTLETAQLRIRVLYYTYYQYLNGFTPDYIMGTDAQGYDMALRIADGIKLSMLIAVFVFIINFIIGALYGAVEGYYGGILDLVLERVSDILNGVPFIVVATLFQLHLAKKVGPLPSLLFAFVLTGWIGTAYRVRTQFYRFKNQEYVMAARTLGARDRRIIWKHIFPNTLGTIITSSALAIPSTIMSESMLSYLGIFSLGGSDGTSLGTLLSDAEKCWTTSPHLMLYPALVISLLMISFNLFGNGLRDAFNPSLRGVEE